MVRHSGIGTYVRNIVPRIIESLRVREVKFHLIGNAVTLREEGLANNGVNVVEEISRIYSVKEQISLVRKLPKNLDLLWVPHYNIPILFRGKLLVTVHDTCHLAVAEYRRHLIKRWYAKGMLEAIARKASAVITVSQFSAGEIIKHSRISPDKVACIHNGVDDSWRSTGSFIDVVNDAPYFVFVGNLKPHKNLIRLITAFSRLNDALPHRLVVVGKKEGFIVGDDELNRLNAKLLKRVEFTGQISDSALRKVMANAVALVFPSIYEGFGLPALEAMALGCPVIAARSTALPEVCGDAALYFDPFNEQDIAETIRSLAQSNELVAELRAKGRARAMRFSWEQSARETVEVMERVVNYRLSPVGSRLEMS